MKKFITILLFLALALPGCATRFQGDLPLKDGRIMTVKYEYPIWTKKSLTFEVDPETGKVKGTVESSETSLSGTLDSFSGVVGKAVESAVKAGIAGAK